MRPTFLIFQGFRRAAWATIAAASLVTAGCGPADELDESPDPDAAEPEDDGEGALLLTPTGFSDSLVTAVGLPTALAFTPDGRMLVATQPGALRVVQSGSLVSTPAISLPNMCTDSERGMLGVTVDPQFATNRYVYLFATQRVSGTCVNRVLRYVLPTSNVIDTSTLTVLLDRLPSPAGNHNAGDVQFGKDGYLYVTVGDGGCHPDDWSRCGTSNTVAREANILAGKVMRITRDGDAPSGNPYLGSDSDSCRTTGRTTAGRKCREVFAMGLRNPFRIAFDPNATGTKFHINDVGQGAWEEINLGTAGANYGWNTREGNCAVGSGSNCGTATGMTNPIFAYDHNTGCGSVTGGAFVPTGVWPAPYSGSYLFSDYVCGKISRLVTGSPNTSANFATQLGSSSAVHLQFGPHGSTQALYYTTFASGGQVRRVAYTGGGQTNTPPTAVIQASPTTGSTPLTVTFNGTQSTDPEGQALTYAWNFGDGGTATGATTSHTYSSAGSFTATLRVTDTQGAQSPTVSTTITPGGHGPVVTITSPAAGQLFRVGETVNLRATATDAEDGTLPASALTWVVLKHHDTHTHPFLAPTDGNDIAIVAPFPEDLPGATNSYLEVKVVAMDSSGATTEATRDFQPRKVNVTLGSSPSGRTLRVNGTSVTAPFAMTSWDGWALNLEAPVQAGYDFTSWSDGGAAAHTVTTPATATTYTANYTATTDPPEPGTGTGLWGEYFDNRDLTYLKRARVDAKIDFDWGSGMPIANVIAPDSFSVRWRGKILPRYSETYTLTTLSDEAIRVWVNGALVVNHDTDHSLSERTGTVALVAGQKADIRVEYRDNTGTAVAKLFWSSSSQPKEIVPTSQLFPELPGLYGEYFNNVEFSTLMLSRLDAQVNFNWGTTWPDPFMGADKFSVRWTGKVVAPTSGTYTFFTQTDDSVRLWVNGVLVVNNWTDHLSTENSGTVALTAGTPVAIKLEYQERLNSAICELRWSGPGISKQLVPASALLPTPP